MVKVFLSLLAYTHPVSEGSPDPYISPEASDDKAANIANIDSHRAWGKRTQVSYWLMCSSKATHASFLHILIARITCMASQNTQGFKGSGEDDGKYFLSILRDGVEGVATEC